MVAGLEAGAIYEQCVSGVLGEGECDGPPPSRGEARSGWGTRESFRLARCEPVYETLPGWAEDISGCRTLADLPAAARRYIDRVAELLGLPISYVSVGPSREQTIQP